MHASYAKSKLRQDEEVVVLSKVLAADINLGYQDTGNIQVLAVNGTKVGPAGLVTGCATSCVADWHGWCLFYLFVACTVSASQASACAIGCLRVL